VRYQRRRLARALSFPQPSLPQGGPQVLPSSVMKSRRLTSDIRLPPSAWGRRRSFYRTLSLPRKGRKVLGADL